LYYFILDFKKIKGNNLVNKKMNYENACFSIQIDDLNRINHMCSSPLVYSNNNRISGNSKPSSGLSFKAKLKSKIFEKRSLKKRMNKNNSDSWSFSLYANQKQQQNNQAKEELGSIVAAFCKIMDKSLGWFRLKSKSKRLNQQQQAKKLKKKLLLVNEEKSIRFSNYTQYSQDNNESIYSDCSMCSNDGSLLFNTQSTPIKNNISQEFKTPYPILSDTISIKTNPFMLHSTPCQGTDPAPICCNLLKSYGSNLSFYSSKSNTRTQRQVFGMTSSPNTSLYDNQHDIDESSIYNNGLVEYEQEEEKQEVKQNQYSFLDLKEKLLVEQLNLIKENVRIGVELRDLKRNHQETYTETEPNSQLVTMSNKKRKLQGIFQSKLRQQLNEVKKWQNSFRNKKFKNNLSTSTKCSIVDVNNHQLYNKQAQQVCLCLSCQRNYNF